ncbi:hypothetical protein [Spiroplasma eriocheiris]|uniref:Uncharacterized protein n=1 Tax=Spiroplasma eriocheiris TaxID=315358 RepID=A0A0H3XHV6_9MOLU|nr:hypothetical protein [Spiroplasma eriocheiris]AHF57529.1 hypothetical protein SPE_0400 [Spiroplasma eriocheiris CCTCC M 207170]AKM53985.1 hypothetical protein SERIO_v1c04060 [Spiroplasma eriocheiris]
MNKTNKKNWVMWLIIALASIIFSASVILNITYLPKYFALKNRVDNTLKIKINAYDATKPVHEMLFSSNYESTMLTLGDLMQNYPDSFAVIASGSLGHWLEGVNTNKGWIKKTAHDSEYWAITSPTNSKCKGNTDPKSNISDICGVGIDDLFLKNNDVFNLMLVTQ